ncbi:MAG: polysaccharide deacetylase family protein [Candidatus Sericytochromatia bacterium]
MKKIVLASLSILLLFACSKENTSEEQVIKDNKTQNTENNIEKIKETIEVKESQKTTKLSPEELKKYQPNEIGLIMVLEYHSIARPEARWTRTPENFRKDLETLYKKGYYLTPLRDFVNNTMNVPAGKSPVVLTFDDSREDQFKYITDKSGKKIIDPDCGVGVIEEFTKKHPDFGKAATFFVLPSVGFGQTREDAKSKFEFLVQNRYEIGNHTLNHPMLATLTDDKVMKEIGENVIGVKKLLPDYDVVSLAYPYGSVPKNVKVVESGSYNGVKYKNIAAFLVGSEPSYSPISKKFKPLYIPRIQAIQSEFDRHFGFFKSAPYYRYISDGNKGTITIPKNLPQSFKDSIQDKYKKELVTW